MIVPPLSLGGARSTWLRALASNPLYTEGCIYSVTPSELLICAAAIRSCSDHLIDKRSDLTATLETLRLWLRLREQA